MTMERMREASLVYVFWIVSKASCVFSSLTWPVVSVVTNNPRGRMMGHTRCHLKRERRPEKREMLGITDQRFLREPTIELTSI